MQLDYWDLVHWRTLLAMAERFLEGGCSLITSLVMTHICYGSKGLTDDFDLLWPATFVYASWKKLLQKTGAHLRERGKSAKKTSWFLKFARQGNLVAMCAAGRMLPGWTRGYTYTPILYHPWIYCLVGGFIFHLDSCWDAHNRWFFYLLLGGQSPKNFENFYPCLFARNVAKWSNSVVPVLLMKIKYVVCIEVQ